MRLSCSCKSRYQVFGKLFGVGEQVGSLPRGAGLRILQRVLVEAVGLAERVEPRQAKQGKSKKRQVLYDCKCVPCVV